MLKTNHGIPVYKIRWLIVCIDVSVVLGSIKDFAAIPAYFVGDQCHLNTIFY